MGCFHSYSYAAPSFILQFARFTPQRQADMKTGVVLYGALLAAAVVFADEKKQNEKKSIALDQVRHIPQPEARSISEKAAVKFKPQILVSEGCHSFPAVNAEGETTVGMKINGISDSTCGGG